MPPRWTFLRRPSTPLSRAGIIFELPVELEWASADDFTRFTREIAAPISALLEQHPQEVRDETWAAVAEAAKLYAETDGTVRLSNLALVAAGRA